MNLVCVFELCLYIIHKDFTDSCVPKSSITTLWTQKWCRINFRQTCDKFILLHQKWIMLLLVWLLQQCLHMYVHLNRVLYIFLEDFSCPEVNLMFAKHTKCVSLTLEPEIRVADSNSDFRISGWFSGWFPPVNFFCFGSQQSLQPPLTGVHVV